jgi:alkanesulfonate monooxygenase SsuD/methylene tetrahydromethanopterin reductase-like flavin-dependent oxidoreductase (luciferase family)
VARERLTAALVGLYRYFGLADRVGALGVSGRPADVAAELQRVLDAGTELVVFHPLYDDAEQMERLVAEVVPLVGAR